MKMNTFEPANFKILPESYVTGISTATRVVGSLPEWSSEYDISRREEILKNYTKDKGYIDYDGKNIWIYKPVRPLNANILPYVWPEDTDKDTWHFAHSHPSDETLKMYSYDNIVALSLDVIDAKTTGEEELYNEEEMMAIYSSTSTFKPPITDKDDGLKKLIKTYINHSGIDVAACKPRLQKDYSLSNMKAALVNNTKMSIKYFNTWNEIFGTTFVITMRDDLGNVVSYDSSTDSCTASKEEVNK